MGKWSGCWLGLGVVVGLGHAPLPWYW
jgi:hypothetical protein